MRGIEVPGPIHTELTMVRHEFSDPYSQDIEKRELFRDLVSHYSQMGFWGNPSVEDAMLRTRKSGIDFNNPPTKELLDKVPGFREWLSIVPRAEALDPLYDPGKTKRATGGGGFDDISAWFANIADGRGLRSRARLVQDIISKEALSYGNRSMNLLSLASGAAQPIISAAEGLALQGCTVDITLIDRDETSLQLAEEYAREASVRVHTKRANILRRRGLSDSLGDRALGAILPASARRRFGVETLQLAEYDMVEAIGFLEYLKEDDWFYKYNQVVRTQLPMAGARTFLRNAYARVRPGGSLVVANMLDSHPELGFTLNVIQWPHIQPRSTASMIQLFNSAGIEGPIDIHLPSDGVYAVYHIRKRDH